MRHRFAPSMILERHMVVRREKLGRNSFLAEAASADPYNAHCLQHDL